MTLRALDRAIEQIGEQDVIGQARQRIGHLRVGNVGERSGETLRGSVTISDRRSATVYPPKRAVSMQHPVLAFVVPLAAAEVRVERVLDAHDVVAVDTREP